MRPSLTVVMPAYNEAENLVPAVTRAVDAVQRFCDDFEVILVDDGSRDASGEIARELLAEQPRLRVLRHPENRGYGAALRTGFVNARKELVFCTDADLQYDVGELEYFLPLIEQADVVVGFRVYRYDPPLRMVLSFIYNRLVRVLFRVRVRDVDCSFKLFRREVLEKISIETTDFFVDTELVARARKWNFRVVEKGVRHYPRAAGETTVVAGHIPRTLRTVFRMWQRIYLPTRAQLEEGAQLQERLSRGVVELEPAAHR